MTILALSTLTLATFAAGFGGLLAVVGKVPATMLTTLAAGFGGFLAIIGEITGIGISGHVFSPRRLKEAVFAHPARILKTFSCESS